MTVRELLALCERAGIRVSVEDDQLRVRAPAGALDDTAVRLLRENKTELIAWLAKIEAADRRRAPAQIMRTD